MARSATIRRTMKTNKLNEELDNILNESRETVKVDGDTFTFTKEDNGKQRISTTRPYDNADYHWAVYYPQKNVWHINIGGPAKKIAEIKGADPKPVYKKMAALNKAIKSNMQHN